MEELMAAGTYDFTWDQGATFDVTLTWRDQNETPVPLDGYTARMQLRTSVDAEDVTIELTTENELTETTGVIELGGDLGDGKIRLIMSAEATAALDVVTYKYDLEMVSDGVVNKLLKGKFKVLAEVTK